MIHVYPLATAFNVDDEKDDNDDENSWIITWQFVFTKKEEAKLPTSGEVGSIHKQISE